MFTPIQLFFIIFILFALSRVILRAREKIISTRIALFWSIIWISALLGIMLPQTTTRLASYFGVGRGVDIIVYISLSLLFYLVFRLYVMLEDVKHDITELIRILAINKPLILKKNKKIKK